MPVRTSRLKIALCLILWLLPVAVVPPKASSQSYPYNQNPQYPYNPNNPTDPYSNPYDPNNANNPYYNFNPFAEADTTANQPDTTRPKIRKPLESFLFDDSTRVRPNFAWSVDMYKNRVHMKDIDTTLNGFQVDYPFLRKGVGDAYQGKLGGASIPLNYFDRPRYENFNFAQGFNTYYFFPGNVDFFNVKKPFSRMGYQWAGQKKYLEENFSILHAQNISPSSGFNLDYRSRGTRGIYQNHRGRAKNLSMAFSHTGKKYTIHAGYIYNAILNRENGGILHESELDETINELPENIPVWLKDARNIIKNNTYYVIQSYGFPLRKVGEQDFSIAEHPTIFVGHAFQYHRWHRNYTDTRAYTLDQLGNSYYENWYINPNETRDSVFESMISNRVFVQIQPWDRNGIVGTIDAGIGMDNHLYYQFTPDQWTHGKRTVKRESYYAYGGVQGQFRDYIKWGGDIIYHPTGDRAGEIKVGGDIGLAALLWKVPVELSGRFSYERRSPDYWSENYFSNHFIWNKSLPEENETRIEASFKMPSINLEVGFGQSLMKNKIYYDMNSIPQSSPSNVTVTSVYLQKNFEIIGFHFNHRLLAQWSSDQYVAPVPEGSAYLSYYFQFDVVRNVLNLQVGADGRINTRWFAPGWNPATSTFYNQRAAKVGEYPMIDVFISAKWKRMRILLKMAHVNQPKKGDYYMIPRNPLNARIFKFGISWAFYD